MSRFMCVMRHGGMYDVIDTVDLFGGEWKPLGVAERVASASDPGWASSIVDALNAQHERNEVVRLERVEAKRILAEQDAST